MNDLRFAQSDVTSYLKISCHGLLIHPTLHGNHVPHIFSPLLDSQVLMSFDVVACVEV